MRKGDDNVAFAVLFCPALDKRAGQRPLSFREKAPPGCKAT
jgi:hypothetical protein